jgi:hypothetical protein
MQSIHFCFSSTAVGPADNQHRRFGKATGKPRALLPSTTVQTGNGIYEFDEVNELALAFQHLFNDEIHARSNIVSRMHMLWEYRQRNSNLTPSATEKKAVNKHYGRLMYLRRKARAEEIISKFKMHKPTFGEVQQYCTEREWRDANILMPIIKNSWRQPLKRVSVRGKQRNSATRGAGVRLR